MSDLLLGASRFGRNGNQVRRILLALGHGVTGDAVVDWVRSNCGKLKEVEVVLLAVEPRPEAVRTRAILIELVRRQLLDSGAKRLAPAAAKLSDLGVNFSQAVEIGDEVATVLELGKSHACDLIVVVDSPMSAVRRWFERSARIATSAASRIARLADQPVVVWRTAL